MKVYDNQVEDIDFNQINEENRKTAKLEKEKGEKVVFLLIFFISLKKNLEDTIDSSSTKPTAVFEKYFDTHFSLFHLNH